MYKSSNTSFLPNGQITKNFHIVLKLITGFIYTMLNLTGNVLNIYFVSECDSVSLRQNKSEDTLNCLFYCIRINVVCVKCDWDYWSLFCCQVTVSYQLLVYANTGTKYNIFLYKVRYSGFGFSFFSKISFSTVCAFNSHFTFLILL